jgi:hypothetical protein
MENAAARHPNASYIALIVSMSCSPGLRDALEEKLRTLSLPFLGPYHGGLFSRYAFAVAATGKDVAIAAHGGAVVVSPHDRVSGT